MNRNEEEIINLDAEIEELPEGEKLKKKYLNLL